MPRDFERLFHRPLEPAAAEARKGELIAGLREYRILVLEDKASPEREVSHKAVGLVTGRLRALGLNATAIAGEALTSHLSSEPTILYNLMYGSAGEGGTVRGFAEWLGLPITYSAADVCPVALDKWRTKLVLEAAGLAVAPSVVLSGEADWKRLSDIVFPVVGKPLDQGSSVGIELFATAAEARLALPRLISLYGPYLVEPFLPGREFTVGVFEIRAAGPLAFPPLEVRVRDGAIADQSRKYSSGALDLLCPAPVGAEFAARLAEIAVKAYRVLGCHPLLRVDLRCDERGAPVVLEANHFPGMTPTSWLPRSAREIGWDFDLLTLEIAEAARHSARQPSGSPTLGRFTGAGMLLVTADDPDPAASDAGDHIRRRVAGSEVATLSSVVGQGGGRQILFDLLYDPSVDTCTARGAVDFGGRPRIGPSLLATALAADKLSQRRIAGAAGILQPDYGPADDPGPWAQDDGPFVLKHRRSMQSEGVRLLREEEWRALERQAPQAFRDCLLERYVGGDEVHVGLSTRLNGCVEILPFFRLPDLGGAWLFDNQAKADIWTRGCCPATIDPEVTERLVEASLRLHECFDQPPLARVEWRVLDRVPILIEYDHWPGLTERSILTRMIAAAGHDFGPYLLGLKRISPPLTQPAPAPPAAASLAAMDVAL